ncbi:hypothetical protein Leryth_021320 [Lithospermum erythrorhizon]|nr:hypothetical protein Leryth_021320 [Lithospermum erythrorhizon]
MILNIFNSKTTPFLLPPPPLSCQENSPLSLIEPLNRRRLLASSISFTISTFLNPLINSVSHARGLFQMPPVRLTNRG